MISKLSSDRSLLSVGHKQVLSVLVAGVSLFLTLSQSFTLVEAPSARPKSPSTRRVVKAYLVAKRRQDVPGDRSPFHPTERVLL